MNTSNKKKRPELVLILVVSDKGPINSIITTDVDFIIEFHVF